MIGSSIFLMLAALAVVTALTVVLHKKPVIQALALVVNLLTIAGMYVLQHAYFFAAVQVIVYAGAIVVLIVFVIMLLNLEREWRGGPGLGTLLFALLIGSALLFLLYQSGVRFELPQGAAVASAQSASYGTVDQIGRALFGPYFFAFEVISLALLAALTGAVLLAKRELED